VVEAAVVALRQDVPVKAIVTVAAMA